MHRILVDIGLKMRVLFTELLPVLLFLAALVTIIAVVFVVEWFNPHHEYPNDNRNTTPEDDGISNHD